MDARALMVSLKQLQLHIYIPKSYNIIFLPDPIPYIFLLFFFSLEISKTNR